MANTKAKFGSGYIIFIYFFIFSICSIIISCNQEEKSTPKQLPNIVLILADDMGWSDLGCFGGEISTPNLDRLAKSGIRFTQFHNTAKCFPSRACLLTGQYAQSVGMSQKPEYFKNAVTLAEVMRSAGYRTLMTGKHHGLDNPFDRGFDHYYGLRDGAANYFNPGHQRPGEDLPAQKRPAGRYWCFDEQVLQPYTPIEEDFYSTDYYTKWAINFLEEYKSENKPFFLYIAYQAPHDPLQAWPEDIAKYRGKYDVGYEVIAKKRYKKQIDLGIIDGSFPRSLPTCNDWNSLTKFEKEKQALKMAVYAAMIDRMDKNIGRVLKKIKDMGQENNTLILFASDNGSSAEDAESNVGGTGEIGSMTYWASLGLSWANVSNTPFRYYKNYSHEGGICTPLIAHWPDGIKNPGRFSKFNGHFIDIMATLVDITGAKYPNLIKNDIIKSMDGESIYDIFLGKEMNRSRPLFWNWSKGKAIIEENWKLVSWDGDWELYNMENDRTETINLATQYPDKVKELSSFFREWLKNVEQ